MNNAPVPAPLRTWFVIHFAVDMLFAVPLLLAPIYTLSLVGWEQVDPITARLTAAALFGIGIESFLGRNAGYEAYRGMLNLKIIWSFAAVFGLVFSMLRVAQGSPPVVWVIALLFVAFNLVWVYWRVQLSGEASVV